MSKILGQNIVTDKEIFCRYMQLDTGNVCQATYIWIDGSGKNLRSKTKTLLTEPQSPEDCPIWNFDGSSTGQAEGSNSDIHLYPRAIFRDPFIGGIHKLIMCDTYDYQRKATASNHRQECLKILKNIEHLKPWFGFEQQYTMMDIDGQPYGWPKNGFPGPQGPYYCAVGANRICGRDVVESHHRALIYSGVKVSGSNAEVMPSQWGYSVGPVEGIAMGDQIWMSRYILHRVAEDYGVMITFDPKPMAGQWNRSECQTYFSTEAMRNAGGIKHMQAAAQQMLPASENVKVRKSSIVVPIQDAIKLSPPTTNFKVSSNVSSGFSGFTENREFSANTDPYSVMQRIVQMTCPVIPE